jgi:hypothetical protein
VLFPHCASDVHVATHRFVVVLQVSPASPQSPLATHWTHRFVVALQCARVVKFVQFASAVHCTQRIVVVSQAGVAPPIPMHCVLEVQETTQRFVVMSHVSPASPQLAAVRHCTH